MGFWRRVGTFFVGSIMVLSALASLLKDSADNLPTWLGWVSSGGTWIWVKLTYEVSAPLSLLIVCGLLLLYSHDFVERAYGPIKQKAPIPEPIADTEDKVPEVQLSPEESSVVDAIIHCDPPVDYGDLLGFTRLSRLRLDHAVNLLRDRLFVRIDSDPYGTGDRYFSLTSEGKAFVVKHNLDKEN